MRKTQFGEKVMTLGFHINEMDDHATIWKEGVYVCKLIYENSEYQLPYHHKYMVPDNIKALVEEYGRN